MTARPTPPSEAWVIHCDGGAHPNPGKMGLGYVATAPDGQTHRHSCTLPGPGCNNEAEFQAAIHAMRFAQRQGATSLHLFSDNSIVVEQLSQQSCAPIQRLADLIDTARALQATFVCVVWTWVPRHRNGEADALARQALGLPAKASVWPGKIRRK